MNKIPSKLHYLRGLLRGMELSGAQKNVIIEQIIEILDLIYDEIKDEKIENADFSALPSIEKGVFGEEKVFGKTDSFDGADPFEETTIKKDSFTTPTGVADVWYDESVNVGKKSEASSYTNKKVPIYNSKTVMEKICKHCGTYIRAELSYDESKRVKIQCPKCKHFILPGDNDFYESTGDKKFSWDDLEEKKHADFSDYDDEEYGEMDDVASILGEHPPYSMDSAPDFSFDSPQVDSPLNKPIFVSEEETGQINDQASSPISYEDYLKTYAEETEEKTKHEEQDFDYREQEYIAPKKVSYSENFSLPFQDDQDDREEAQEAMAFQADDKSTETYPTGSFFGVQEDEQPLVQMDYIEAQEEQVSDINFDLKEETETGLKQGELFSKEQSIQQLEDEMLFQESSASPVDNYASESENFAALSAETAPEMPKVPNQVPNREPISQPETLHQKQATQYNLNTIGDAIDNLAAAFLGDTAVGASSRGGTAEKEIEKEFHGYGSFMDGYEPPQEEAPKKESGKIFSRFFKK